MKALLGGKGANLAEMTRIGLPVPPGFTITTEVCTYFYANKRTYPKELQAQIEAGVANMEKIMGTRFGNKTGMPLLVAVRSGARDSMPGMMDTILNLGLNDETVQSLAKATNKGSKSVLDTAPDFCLSASTSRCICKGASITSVTAGKVWVKSWFKLAICDCCALCSRQANTFSPTTCTNNSANTPKRTVRQAGACHTVCQVACNQRTPRCDRPWAHSPCAKSQADWLDLIQRCAAFCSMGWRCSVLCTRATMAGSA
jgi:hypothetical protein